MAKRKRGGPPRIAKHQVSKSPYFMQPGKRGVFVVLHRACGNRVVPKVCGEMPSRTHAKMLITQLERAESVVKDLFLEATDDGIEALEAVLAACREEVLRRGPRVHEGGTSGGETGGGSPDGSADTAGRGAPRPRRGRPPRGRRGTPKFEPPTTVRPTDSEAPRTSQGEDPPYNEAAS
jgi:hypothetical protein